MKNLILGDDSREAADRSLITNLTTAVAFMQRFAIAGLAIVSLLSGCNSAVPNSKTLESDLRTISKAGYLPEHHYKARMVHEVWEVDDANWDISVAMPDLLGTSPLPVVIYFPGLGETADAGLLWRKSWAESGYLVISVQPQGVGMAIWSTPRAKSGEFQAIAGEQFSAEAAVLRAHQLVRVVDEIARRGAVRESVYASADLTRVGLAGYDLGSQTASILSGERLPGYRGNLPVISAQALVTISPYFIGPEGDGAVYRYSGLNRPVLTVTATNDGDPYSLIASPDLRQIPWHYFPGSSKFLLVLQGASHRVLAGDNLINPEAPGVQGNSASENNGRQGKKRYWDEQQFESRQQHMKLDDNSPASDQKSPSGRSGNDAIRAPRPYDLRQIAAVQDVTTAFLDMNVKKRKEAEAWLLRDAGKWLGAAAQLTIN